MLIALLLLYLSNFLVKFVYILICYLRNDVFVKYEKTNGSRVTSCNRCNKFSHHNLFSIAPQNVKVLLSKT